ncbi:MAG: type II toxin-antitoxin system VapC family toxin [Nitrospirae bacterium]|nr:type II toxin-antitoxin system VapC family toxin [Nitrospirota bacterium]
MKIVSSPVYLDTSALIKIYVSESGSDELEDALEGRTDLLVSDLSITEATSAIWRRVRQSHLSARDAGRVYQRLIRDLRDGQYQHLDLTPDTHRRAEQFLMTLGTSQSLRAADALHIALATGSGAHTLITFDRRMAESATIMGTLDVLPPVE